MSKESMSYNQICAAIDSAPRSYLGGILAHAIRVCVRRSFFRSNDALRIFICGKIDETESENTGGPNE